MTSEKQSKNGDKQFIKNLTLAAAAGQVGCLTLVIVIGAVIAGLWLDNYFDTKPIITLVLVVVSVPVSVVAMLAIVRGTVKRIQFNNGAQTETANKKEEGSALGRENE
ncbi:MAG: AtpZ/AtpI family protein [Anaerolineaceae bacterium]|nr:AtpZ/AtpI family protein [Anaerolineaceae bacterium]